MLKGKRIKVELSGDRDAGKNNYKNRDNYRDHRMIRRRWFFFTFFLSKSLKIIYIFFFFFSFFTKINSNIQ